MGFFSSVSKLAGGLGGASSSESSGSSQSGWALLPPEIQKAFTGYAPLLQQYLDPTKAGNVDRFTPMGLSEYENTALDSIGRGITPTEDTLRSDIAMQMNPFDDFVINDINRQAGGDYSILKQDANAAGQFGSNRQSLGANDIDLTRLNLIGKFKQDQYNTALDNSLTKLTDARGADIGMQLGAGGLLRDLDTQTKQAPINALTSYGQLLGALPQSGGSQSQQSASSQGESGGLGGLVKTAGTVASIASMFSDRNLKENIKEVGERNGFPIYEFNYKDRPDERFRGVMAQDVQEIMPEAVSEIGGKLAVDYGMLGFEMEVV